MSAFVVVGCGGGSAKPQTGGTCTLNSQCDQPLVCTFGKCHAACNADTDCITGQLCVKTTTTPDGGTTVTGNVCQLPAELKCVYNSQCSAPLVCARDEQCRNQCQATVDCVTGQICTTSGVCATPDQLVAGTNDVMLVTAGMGGAGGQAGGGASGGSAGAAGGSKGTGGTAGGAGAGGAAGSGAAGAAGGAGGASVGCGAGCGVDKQCVDNVCQPCGTAGISCCGTGDMATCDPNLTCVSGTCTCGDVSQACCSGTTCNTGLQCSNGKCGCGSAGQYCCSGTNKCTGTLVCGGRRCGCAQACDESAALKNDGSIYISGTPVTKTDGTLFTAASVSNNSSFTCAVKTDGTVWCWGSNSYGALGIGDTTIASAAKPTQVQTAAASGMFLTGITSVTVSDYGYSACAIGAGGTLWCWGYGGYGQLGIGDESNSAFAVPVVTDSSNTPVTGFKTVSVSYQTTCGMKTDNTVWCWGDNQYGQVGIGVDPVTNPTTSRYVVYPAQVTKLAQTATSVITNYYNYTSCASVQDGSVWCWGYNSAGDLGNGLATGYANVPSQVLTAASTPLTGVSQALNWSSRPCALKTDGSIWCWPDPAGGTNYYAVQLKDSNSARVTGLTVVGRNCYIDIDDQVWVNAYTSTSYQVTCP
ncbi:MAG TPA: hypothetical protein VMT03_10240 [Polyangia bacterium]|nr:hypothetical protein [Polyangia bacterium]